MAGNIVSGNDVQTQAVLAAGVLPMLVLLLEHPRQNVRREAAWAFSNITAGTWLPCTLNALSQLRAVPCLAITDCR
jgi:importin subunit alpha-1